MKPEQFLQQTKAYLVELERAKRLEVKVGLPAETVGTKIYEDGATVLEVGAAHEFGLGVPRRSFLRVPFAKERDVIAARLNKEFERVLDGRSTASRSLQIVGLLVENISRRAFSSEGYGTWTRSQRAEEQGGQTLVDTGVLRSSITSVVVDAS